MPHRDGKFIQRKACFPKKNRVFEAAQPISAGMDFKEANESQRIEKRKMQTLTKQEKITVHRVESNGKRYESGGCGK